MNHSRIFGLAVAFLLTLVHSAPAESRPFQRKQPARKITGTLLIESFTKGARVYVDGDEVGTLPLTGPIKLMPGSYSVKVTKLGYTEFMETVTISAGKTVKLELDLFAVKGILTLDSAPSGARVYLGDKFLGKTPLEEIEVDPGTHNLRVARTGFHDSTRKLEAKAGVPAKLIMPLIPLPADLNPLIVKTVPPKWYEKWWVWTSAAGGVLALVTAIVVCELVWVLTSCYDLSRSQVVEVLRNLQRARELALQSPDELARALTSFAAGKGDLADYLIREQARTEGCDAVATFDRAVLGEAGFVEP